MNKPTFTQGPWRVSPNIHLEEHGEQEYLHLTAKEKHSDIGMVKIAKLDPIRSNDHANARLIAIAPEMHALLARVASDDLGDVQTAVELAMDAREILAKVEGEK